MTSKNIDTSGLTSPGGSTGFLGRARSASLEVSNKIGSATTALKRKLSKEDLGIDMGGTAVGSDVFEEEKLDESELQALVDKEEAENLRLKNLVSQLRQQLAAVSATPVTSTRSINPYATVTAPTTSSDTNKQRAVWI